MRSISHCSECRKRVESTLRDDAVGAERLQESKRRKGRSGARTGDGHGTTSLHHSAQKPRQREFFDISDGGSARPEPGTRARGFDEPSIPVLKSSALLFVVPVPVLHQLMVDSDFDSGGDAVFFYGYLRGLFLPNSCDGPYSARCLLWC